MKYMIAVFAVAVAVAATVSARPQDPVAPRKGHALAPVRNRTIPSGNETQQQQQGVHPPQGRPPQEGVPPPPQVNLTRIQPQRGRPRRNGSRNETRPEHQRPAGRHGGHPRIPVLNGTATGDNSTNPQEPEPIRRKGNPRLPVINETNSGDNASDPQVKPEQSVANTRVARRANPHDDNGRRHNGGRHGPGGRGPRPHLNGTEYIFALKDENDNNSSAVNVSAIALNGSRAVIFKRNNRPEGRGKDGSCGFVVYSYNNTDLAVIFAPKNPKDSCILYRGSGLTYEQLVNGVKERNGTVVDAPTQRLDATGQNLTAEESQKLEERHRNATKVCRNRPIVVATPASGDGAPARNDTKQIFFYDLNNIYNVTVNGTTSTPNALVRIGGDGEGIRDGGPRGHGGPRGRPPPPGGRPGENDNRRRN